MLCCGQSAGCGLLRRADCSGVPGRRVWGYCRFRGTWRCPSWPSAPWACSAIFWLVVVTLSLVAFYTLDYNGYSFPNDPAPYQIKLVDLLSLIGLAAMLLGLTQLYETAKKRTLAELRSTEDSLLQEKGFANSTIASLPGIFYLFDNKGRFLRWNENFECVSGYSPEELSTMRPLDFFRRTGPRGHQTEHQNRIQTGPGIDGGVSRFKARGGDSTRILRQTDHDRREAAPRRNGIRCHRTQAGRRGLAGQRTTPPTVCRKRDRHDLDRWT